LSEKERLSGSLQIVGFHNLQFSFFDGNNLETLYVSDCKDLVALSCYDNIMLRELICINSQLYSLRLDRCCSLTMLRLDNNQLAEIGFFYNLPYPSRLTDLYIANNKFLPQDLSFLKEFINLQKLDLSGNNFYGSLEPLRSMKRLELLNIRKNNIDGG